MTEIKDKKRGLATLAIHGGLEPSQHQGATNVPIYQTATYQFESSEHAAALFSLQQPGYIYTRIGNPTTAVLEQRLAQLEGGVGALVTSSGQAASLLSILNIAQSGDEIVAAKNLYGGTFTLLKYTLKRLGIDVHFVEQDQLEQWEAKINDKTKAFFLETVSNPSLEIPDIEQIANIAHEHGIPLIVDNTFASPALFKPLDFGADIVVHSTTKYIGGHATALGGVIIDGGKFPWDNGRFPLLSEPEPAYHGLCFTDAVGNLAYITKAIAQLNRDIGATISPFNAFLLTQGLETLPLRMERHSSNALAVAKYLEQHPNVEWVNYPGLESHPSYELTQKYLKKGQSGLLTFGINGGFSAAQSFIDKVKIFTHVANIGDVRSLVIHPTSTTHQQLSEEEKQAAGVTDDLIRLSIGIEDIEDLLADLEQALA